MARNPAAEETKDYGMVGFSAKPSLIKALGAELLEGRDLKLITKAALDYLNVYARAETSFACLLQGNRLEVTAVHGPHVRRLAKSKFEISDSVGELLDASAAVKTFRDVSLQEVDEPDDLLLEKLSELGLRSVLISAFEGVGIIVLADPKPDVFTSFHEAGVGDVSAQLGYIIRTIRRETETVEASAKLEGLLGSISKARASGDTAKALEAVVAAIVERTGADSGSLLLLDQRTDRLALGAAVGTGRRLDGVDIPVGEGIAGWVASHKKPLTVTDLSGATASGNGMGAKTAAALAFPVMAGDDLIGVLNLGSKDRTHAFTLDEIHHLVSVLAQIGASVAAKRGESQWRELFFETIKSLVRVIESRNPFQLGHSVKVAEQAAALAGALALDPAQAESIELAAFLHDVGVAAFAADVLGKESALSESERLILRSHPVLGRNALLDIGPLRDVLPLIQHHHENFDGTGYTDGLAGEGIPLGARILAVAEAYVGMTSDRPYRPAKSHDDAMNELREGAGKEFDPGVVEAFENLKRTSKRTGRT